MRRCVERLAGGELVLVVDAGRLVGERTVARFASASVEEVLIARLVQQLVRRVNHLFPIRRGVDVLRGAHQDLLRVLANENKRLAIRFFDQIESK